MKNKKLSIKNKKAFFNYDIIEIEISGIILEGCEVKSIREGRISFNDSYCDFIENELWLKNFHITEYEKSSTFDKIDPKRNRKLLLTKKQLKKFQKKYDEKGLTIVPLNIFFNEKNLVKIEIGLARGKKMYDKKNSISERDIERETKKYIINND